MVSTRRSIGMASPSMASPNASSQVSPSTPSTPTLNDLNLSHTSLLALTPGILNTSEATKATKATTPQAGTTPGATTSPQATTPTTPHTSDLNLSHTYSNPSFTPPSTNTSANTSACVVSNILAQNSFTATPNTTTGGAGTPNNHTPMFRNTMSPMCSNFSPGIDVSMDKTMPLDTTAPMDTTVLMDTTQPMDETQPLDTTQPLEKESECTPRPLLCSHTLCVCGL